MNCFQFPYNICKKSYCDTREDVYACIQKNRKWNWMDATFDLRKISFYQHMYGSAYARFQLGHSFGKPLNCIGQGSVVKYNKDFLEYLFLVLSDRTAIEAWTYRDEPAKTYLAYNGNVVFTIHSTWKCVFFNLIKWRIKWDVFYNNDLLGFVDGKGVIRWNSLKMSRSQADSIPIHLAYPERKMTEVVLAPLRLICGDTSKNYSDYVIPEGTLLKDDEVLLGFMINVVFREMFYDLAYPASNSGA